MPDQVATIAKQAPHWAALVLVVGGFLWYLDRSSNTDDLVAKQRIDACHQVQTRSNEVLTLLADNLNSAAVEDARLRAAIEDFEKTLDRHTQAVDRLLDAMGAHQK